MHEDLSIVPAEARHNDALIALFRETPIASDSLSYRIDRGPDYLAFSRVQGEDTRVLVAERDLVLGTMTVAFSRVYLGGSPTAIAYTGDLRVAPAARGAGVGDRLMREAVRLAKETLGPAAPIVTAVAADNAAGLRKNANLGRDGVTTMARIGAVRTHFLLPLALPLAGAWGARYAVRRAGEADVPAMVDMWRRAKAGQDLARAFTDASFSAWLTAAGLGLDRFWLAEADGRLRGFLATWDQSPLRRFMLTKPPPLVETFMPGLSLLGAIAGLPPWPGRGEQLRFQNVVNHCVEAGHEEALAAMLPPAFERVRREGGIFLGLALDARDPLNGPLKRFAGSGAALVLLGNEHVPPSTLHHIEIALG